MTAFKTLRELVAFQGGGTPSKQIPEYWNGEIPWASVKDFKTTSLSETQDFITEEGLRNSSTNLIPKGHVIIPTRMSLGKAAINTIDLAINQDLRALIPKVPIHAPFLLHAILSLKDEILKKGAGATVKGITQDELYKLEIAFPSFDNQIRIAHLLDKVESLIAQRKQHLQQIDDLLKSIFLDMFGDPVSNNKRWETASLKTITSKIGSGATPSGGNEAYKKEGISLIRSMNVHDGKFVYSDLAYIDHTQATKLKNVEVEENDVLLNITGASVCRCTIVPTDVLPARVNQHVAILRPKTEELNSKYLAAILISDSYKKFLLKISRINGATREALTKDQLEKLFICKPPINIQNRFAEIAGKIEKIKSCYYRSISDLEMLYGALSQQAFKGELDLSKIPLIDEAPTETNKADILFRDQKALNELSESEYVNITNLINQVSITPPSSLIDKQGNTNAWLDAYINYVKKNKKQLHIKLFIQVCAEKWGEISQFNQSTIAVSNYEKIKDKIFEKLHSSELQQEFDEESIAVRLKLAKGA